MARHLRLTVVLALCGVALVLAVLARLAVHQEPYLVPAPGGTYIEAVVGTPQWVNPVLSSFNEVDQDLCSLLFRGLTRVDEHLRMVPDLAESWEASGNGLQYTFKLRPGLKWQDGAPVTASDVVYTFGLVQSPDYPGPPFLSELWQQVRIEQVGDLEVRFTLQEPYAPFLDYTSMGLLPSHALADVAAADLVRDPFMTSPIGNGPFMLKQLTAEQAVLIPNPHYEGKQPLLEELTLRFYSDPASAIAAYENGVVNGIRQIPPDYLDDAAELSNLNLYSAPRAEAVWLILNTQAAPLQDAAVRRALSLAINRRALIDDALHGQALPIFGPLLPNSWAYNPAMEEDAYDPRDIPSLLGNVGWTDSDGDGVLDKEGQPLSLEIVTPEVPPFVALAEEIAAQWKELGIQATAVPVSQGELAGSYLRPRRFQVAIYYWMDVTPDPDLYPFLHSTQIADPGQNFALFENRDADEIMEAARQTADPTQRQELYSRLQEILKEQAPIIALYQPVFTMGVSNEVHGVTLGPSFTPSDRFLSIADWYMYTQRTVENAATATAEAASH